MSWFLYHETEPNCARCIHAKHIANHKYMCMLEQEKGQVLTKQDSCIGFIDTEECYSINN